MKILMLIDALDIGGAETHTITLAKGLAKQGHKVEVVSAEGELTENLCKVGIKHIKIPNIRKNDRDNSLPLFVRILVAHEAIWHKIHTQRPNIVHAHTRRMAYLAHDICRWEKIPLVTTAHAKFPARNLKNLFTKWGDATVAVSEDIKENLSYSRHFGRAPRHVNVILNGIEIE